MSLALIVPQVNFFTNTAFLGRVGAEALGVNGVAGVFYLILSMIGYGLSNGLQVQMSRRAGEGNKAALTRTFMNGVMLSIVLALLLMLLSLWFAPLIFALSLHSSSNMLLSTEFIYLRVWGLPMLMLMQMANAYFISIGKTRMLIWGSLAGAFLNIVFDYLLIFGYGGFRAMGLQGAAIASAIGEAGGCMVMYVLLVRSRSKSIRRYLGILEFRWSESWQSLKVAFPLIVQFLFSIGGWLLFFILVEHLGKEDLAASQVLRSVIGIVSVGCWALANTCNMMVSNVIGQGKYQEVIPVIKRVMMVSLVYALVVCTVLFLFAQEFLLLYRNELAFAQHATPAMRVVVIGAMLMALATVVFNGVVGTGNTRINLLIEVLCVGLYIVYCVYVIEVRRMSLAWAWGSDVVYWASLIILSVAYLTWGKWQHKQV